MAEPSPALRKQVERLRDALSKDGEQKQAASLSGILTAVERLKEMTPSRIERSRAAFAGEVLGRNTQVPVDRETAASLAEIIFPAEINAEPPLFNPTVTQAVSTIIDEWTNFEALSAVDISPAKTCLIYGVPGTGKTRLALWIACKLDLPVLLVKLDG